MPTYSFKNNNTGEEFEMSMKLEEKQAFLSSNQHITQMFNKFPGYSDPARLGLKKPDDGFRDVLKNIGSHHKYNTINSF
jgi:antibiotic biosynthesis monooxygenase (ABM) superfamily enzyme